MATNSLVVFDFEKIVWHVDFIEYGNNQGVLSNSKATIRFSSKKLNVNRN